MPISNKAIAEFLNHVIAEKISGSSRKCCVQTLEQLQSEIKRHLSLKRQNRYYEMSKIRGKQ